MAHHDGDSHIESLFGALDAARYLGIHRSTLHLAVQRGTLVADNTTPGGHLRFRQETLDAFKRHFEHNPITRDESAIAPLEVLRTVSSNLSARRSAADVCQAAADSILHSGMGFDVVAVMLVNHDSGQPELETITSVGLTSEFITEWKQLFKQGTEIATSIVLRSFRPEVVGDTEREHLRYGTGHLVRLSGVRSYAVCPLARGAQGIGALVVASTAPHQFTASDRAFLNAISSELSLAISIQQSLELTSELIQMAMGRSFGPESPAARASSRLERLRDLLLRRTAAEDICVLGFDDGGILSTADLRLCTLAEHARAEEMGIPIMESWKARGEPYTGMAVGAPHYDGQPVSVALLWRGKCTPTTADRVLLLVFAGACALASSHIRPNADHPLVAGNEVNDGG